MALAIRDIVSLTEAFQMEQAVKFQSGPFTRDRQQRIGILHTDPGISRPSAGVAVEEPMAGSIGVAASKVLDPWGRKTLLSIGELTKYNLTGRWVVD